MIYLTREQLSDLPVGTPLLILWPKKKQVLRYLSFNSDGQPITIAGIVLENIGTTTNHTRVAMVDDEPSMQPLLRDSLL